MRWGRWSRLLLAGLLVVIAGVGGYLVGSSGAEEKTVTETVVGEVPAKSRTDELREEFGIPTDQEAREEFGLP